MSLGRAKVLAHVDDDDQRSIPKAEIDELTKRSGKNIRGYMPSASLPISVTSCLRVPR